jgi:hypothetical protein
VFHDFPYLIPCDSVFSGNAGNGAAKCTINSSYSVIALSMYISIDIDIVK